MPRKRPKTAADRPTYRPTAPLSVPQKLEPFLDGLELRRIVQQYGLQNVELALALIAERQRREMIERRLQEIRDAWKQNVRPRGPIRIPRAVGGRQWRRHNQTLEQHLDNVIFHEARIRELEDGLAIVLDQIGGGSFARLRKRAQLMDIVSRVKDGETAAQIAKALHVSERTVENRLAELREAASSS